MRNGSVFVYGAAPRNLVGFALAALPFYPEKVTFAHEHFGEGLKIDWSDKQGARRRNCVAAMKCNALIIVGRPRFTASVVKAFVQRGRRIFWYNPKTKRLIERDGNPQVFEAFRRCEPVATWEPDLWEQQRAEKFAKIEEYLDAHPEKARTPDEIPTFGWVEVFNEDEIECSDTDIFKRCRRSKLAEM